MTTQASVSREESQKPQRYIPPWKEPYIIALAGSSGSGKTSIAQTIIKRLNVPWSVLISMDNFYKPLNSEDQQLAFKSKYDFDAPSAIDIDLVVQVLKDLKHGKRVRIPNYSFVSHNRTDQWTSIYGANIIVLEGIFALLDPRVLELVDLKIFVDTSLDVCLARRLTRDVIYRGREVELSVIQWQRFVKPNFELHVRPSMNSADIRIPRGIDNVVAIDLLMAHIQRQLEKNSMAHMNYLLSLSTLEKAQPDKFDTSLTAPNLILLKETRQIRALNTFILACGSEISHSDSQTSAPSTVQSQRSAGDPYGPLKKFFTSPNRVSHFDRADFVFHFDRVAFLLIHQALDEFAYGPGSTLYGDATTQVRTPGGSVLKDATRMVSQPAAVQLLRGGECFDTALRQTIRDIPLGKILIQSNARTGEPQLHSLSLPPCVDPRITKEECKAVPGLDDDDLRMQRRTKILLCDTQLSSGAAVTMSVAILLDHGIKQENIVVVVYMATQIAVQRLYSAYPQVKVVVGILTQAVVPRFVDNVYFGTT